MVVKPVAPVVDHPRRHDAGDGAGKARQQRDEGAAVQAGAAHDAVHQERRARHVAEVFEQQDEQEQDQDLRQEDDHAADAGDHPVLDEALQQAGRQRVVRHGAERIEAGRDQIHQRLRPGEHRLEHDEQQASRMSRPATGCSSTASTRPVSVSGRAAALTATRMMRSASRWAARRSDAVGGFQVFGMLALGGARSHRVDAPQQVLGAAAAHRGRSDHRRAKLFRQLVEIDLDAAPARDVDHVEHQHQRAADLLELDHQAQRDAQIGGVGDAKQQVGRAPRWRAARARCRG